jgi:cation diffusion facilitator family transporter
VSGEHQHHYLHHRHERNERRTRWVVVLTAAMMVGEITVGWISGSMALTADGWHMATHTLALGVSALAYWLARRWAHDERYSFGTGKIGDLAGFASALALAAVAIGIAAESVSRLMAPRNVDFRDAILVAVLGLVVNLVSAALLHEGHGHSHGHDHDGHHHHHHRDLNLRSAYLHVVADALTSVLAIVALAGGMWAGIGWLDPLAGVVGAVVILAWSRGLVRDTSAVLLDRVPDPSLADSIRRRIEEPDAARITDLHLWQVGPGSYAVIVALAASEPRPPAHYKQRLAGDPRLVHVTVEVTAQ